MKNLMKKGLVLSGLAIAMSTPAFAATSTANFTATAIINSSCVVSATNMDFGSISPASSGNSTTTSTITATCSNAKAYTLSLDKGSGTSIAARSMEGTSGNTDKLLYNIHTDSGSTVVFGDGAAGSATIPGVGNGQAQAVTVYGKLALNQYLRSDTYTDNLTVTLTY